MTATREIKRALVFTFFMLSFVSRSNSLVYAEIGVQKKVIILPFNNSTGDSRYEGLSAGFADLIAASLSHQSRLSVVDRDSLKKALNEASLQLQGITAKNALQIGKLMSADRLVTGGFSFANAALTVNVHVFDTNSTQLLGSKQFVGTQSELPELADKLGKFIATTAQENPELNGAVDSNPELHLHFMRGLGYFYSSLFSQAVSEFMQALVVDPAYAEARFWVGKSYFADGAYAHAEIEFERFLKDFPTNPFVKDVQELLLQSRVQAVRHEIGAHLR